MPLCGVHCVHGRGENVRQDLEMVRQSRSEYAQPLQAGIGGTSLQRKMEGRTYHGTACVDRSACVGRLR